MAALTPKVLCPIRYRSPTIIGGIITSNQVAEIRDSGHAPQDGRESAIIADLSPGNYTAIVRGVNQSTGVALAEVYDLTGTTGSFLGNISTRSFVQTGDNVMIGGFIIQGTGKESNSAGHWTGTYSTWSYRCIS